MAASVAELRETYAQLDVESLAYLHAETKWRAKARPNQILPRYFGTCLIRSGRGWGKTEVGSNWSRRKIWTMPGCIGHIIAPTGTDVIGTMIEGISGILQAVPDLLVVDYAKSWPPTITFSNGSVIRGFSAETPDRMRGPQCHWVWADEPASWLYLTEAVAQIDFSNRLKYTHPDTGEITEPEVLYTTTPRPLPFIRELLKTEGVLHIVGSTYENRANLADKFFQNIVKYEGTQFGRQEIYGDVLDPTEGGIIKKSDIRLWNKELPQFEYIYISMDTAFTEETFDKKALKADFTACQVWGVFGYNKRMNLMLLEAWKERIGMPELILRCKEELKATYGQPSAPMFQPLIPNSNVSYIRKARKPDELIIEDKGSGISLRQMLARENVVAYAYNPGRASKLERVHQVSHLPVNGRIWLPESAKRPGHAMKFCEEPIEELCSYSGPGTTEHDDHVDTASQVWKRFADMYLSSGADEKKKIEEPKKAPVVTGNPYG